MSVPSCVITHFFNEKYLLPWWLLHHRYLFTDGILIDYASSDESRDIIRQLVPHWKVVSSRNLHFEAEAVDAEVEHYETTYRGWKMALNVTEFLVGDLDLVLKQYPRGPLRLRVSGRTMVDLEPDSLPRQDLNLTAQKPWGVDATTWLRKSPYAYGRKPRHWLNRARAITRFRSRRRVPEALNSAYSPVHRGRLLHSTERGHYKAGRHYWEGPTQPVGDLEVLWFGLSPWNAEARARKAQVRTRIPIEDTKRGFGGHHFWSSEDLEALHDYWSHFAVPCPLATTS